MRIKYEIDDGYVNRGRQFWAEVDDDDLADCDSEEEANLLIEACIREAFEEAVTWYSDAMKPAKSRELWIAARAKCDARIFPRGEGG